MALRKLRTETEISGFRKGRATAKVITDAVGEINILERAAEAALLEAVSKMLANETSTLVTRPEIAITKIARGNPLAFTLKIVTTPKIKLPDYKAIARRFAKKKEIPKVTDKEVADAAEKIGR